MEMDKVFDRITTDESFMAQMLKEISEITNDNSAIEEPEQTPSDIRLTETLDSGDPRCHSAPILKNRD